MKRYALSLTMLLSLAALLPVQGTERERRIPLSEYADKVRAAWLGKMAGVGWGITTEFRYSHRLVPDSMMQAWRPEMVNEGYNQDDLYLSLLSLELLRQYGPEITSRRACLERQNMQFEYGGRNALVWRDSIAPPDLGHPLYKPTSDGCGYTCGADYSGIAAPGLPAAPVRFAATFGSDRCYGDGLYGGVFVGAMYCEAFFTEDLHRIVDAALRSIPEQSLLSRAVRDVVRWHRLYPDDWKRTWQLIMDNYWWNEENNWIAWPYGGVRKGINLDSKSMAAMSVMALLYGEGDLYRTMRIAVQASEDSDCNASIAAGVLLASRGMKAVDEELLTAFDCGRRFKYFSRNFDGMVDLTLDVARQVIPTFGGRIEVRDGEEWIVVPARGADLRCTEYLSSKTPGPLTGSRYTADELDCLELLTDPGFENDDPAWSFFSDLKNNHILPVERIGRIEGVSENRARTGFCNALLGSWFHSGYPRANTRLFSGVRQLARVAPGREYRLSCFVRTEGGGFGGKGVVRVLTPGGREMASATFGDKPEWTRVGLDVANGGEDLLVVEIGFRGVENRRMTLRIDDCSLKVKPSAR